MSKLKINGELDINSYLTAISDLYLSSADGASIIFRNGTAEAGRITSNGYLQLGGTSTGAYRLYVNGNSYFTGTNYLYGTTYGRYLYPSSDGSYSLGSSSYVWGSAYIRNLQIYDTTNNRSVGSFYASTAGTTSASGISRLVIGNSYSSGTAGNAYGVLRIYSTSSTYGDLRSSGGSVTHYLPSTGGTLLNTGNYNSYVPKKDGTGATGTWAINISGNAATATAAGTATIAGTCTGNSATATNADKLDGYHSSDFMGYTSLWIDASSLDTSTYYPVTIPISHANGLSRIKLAVQLNSGTVPSWSTHSAGFTSNIDIEIIASGWGTVSYTRYIKYQDDYNFATVKPAYFAGQLYTASQAVFYVRGGGKYHFIMHWQNATATLHTASTTLNNDTIAPTTSDSQFHNGTYSSIDTHITGGAKYLFDSSNSTATYLNYGASGITSTSWMAAWNGYELRAMSPDYVCASRLYSTDSSYKYSSGNPYYGYLTYNSPYWDFKVYPASPADVRVSRAYTAGTADNANWAAGATYAQSVYGTYTGNGGNQVPSYIGANRTKFNMMRKFGNGDIGGYMDCILMNNYSWSDVPYATGLGITKVNDYPRAMIANGPQGNWAYTAELLTSYNYSWWAVPVSGGTMTGRLKIQTNGITLDIGAQNQSWVHIYNGAVPFIFDQPIWTIGCFGIYQMNSKGCGSSFPSSPTTGQIFFKI